MEDAKHYMKTYDTLPDYTLVSDGRFLVCIGKKGGIYGESAFDIGQFVQRRFLDYRSDPS